MAKTSLIALIKPIEATKVHPRSGLSLGLADITIPYGALIEHLGSDRDREKFAYLGDHYTCTRERYRSATAAAKAEPAPPRAGPQSAAPAPAEESARAEPEPVLVWQQLPSKEYSLSRAAIPGGWLVVLNGASLTFVPDAGHQWDGASVE